MVARGRGFMEFSKNGRDARCTNSGGTGGTPVVRVKQPPFVYSPKPAGLLRRRRNGVFRRRRSGNSRGLCRRATRYRLAARRRGFARWRGGGPLRRWQFFGRPAFGDFSVM